ncbi:MAG: hypothetical protein OEZ32_09655 [Nitrospinota bacterium]|nr:hypothetical protein [Nitrospinota bacterium]
MDLKSLEKFRDPVNGARGIPATGFGLTYVHGLSLLRGIRQTLLLDRCNSLFLGPGNGHRLNLKHQGMYDQIAVSYNIVERGGGLFRGDMKRTRLEILQNIIPVAGCRALEVSPGTGSRDNVGDVFDPVVSLQGGAGSKVKMLQGVKIYMVSFPKPVN